MRSLWTPGLGRYLLAHPGAILPLASAGWRLRRAHWARRAPFLPLPDRAYWHFRMVTVNGATGTLSPHAMVEAARWAVQQPKGRRT